MIKVLDVSKKFNTSQGLFFALQNVSFEIKTGECTVIGGENGSGKSVLMSILSGLDKPSSGKIEIDERVGLVFQEADTQILGETVFEDVQFGPKNLGFKKDKINKNVENALTKTNLIQKSDFPARFLSGGEKRRLAVACMISMENKILILDEPYANLDYSGVKQVNEIIKILKSEGKTVIILTHEIEKCLGLAQKFIVLYKGKKVFDANPEEIKNVNLEQWNIRNPFNRYEKVSDLVWE